MRNKQTKIVATISDLNCDMEFIKALHERGMNVVRMNTAHQSLADTLKVVRNTREVCDRIGIMVDTKGPEVRTGKVDAKIVLHEGQGIVIRCDDYTAPSNEEVLQVNYGKFVEDIPVGSSILIDDGELHLKVIGKTSSELQCEAENDGVIGSRKSVNVPGVSMDLPSLTEKDRQYVDFCIEHGIEFIAHSFIRNKEDLLVIQNILDEANSPVKLIAKIENLEGINNIDEILDHCYGVMIARGDMGVEIPAEQVPVYQKMLIEKCREKGKPVITATQMLQSMIDNPRATRAEISDVANAVYDGTDAIMLSGETAHGRYPEEAVGIMSKVSKYTEASGKLHSDIEVEWGNEIHKHMTKSIIHACEKLPIQAIITTTNTGANARLLAAYRGKTRIYTSCYKIRVARELSLVYGVEAYSANEDDPVRIVTAKTVKGLIDRGTLKPNDLVIIMGASPGENIGVDYFKIREAHQVIAKLSE